MTRAHRILAELRRIRQESRICQEAIGEALGLTRGDVSQYELGRIRPRVDLVAKWAEQLGYEVVLMRKDR